MKSLIIAEHRQGALRAVTLEAITGARTVGEEITVALLAADPAPLVEALRGASPRVVVAAHPDLADYNPEHYLPVLEGLIADESPDLVLLPHTSQGMDLAPALAGRLGLPLVTDATALEAGEALRVRRQIFAGKVVEELELAPRDRWLVTLQPGAFGEAEAGRSNETVERPVSQIEPRHARRLVEYLRAASGDVDIGAADILVAVGRGIGKEENVALAQALADAVGGTLACSRPVADAGWLPKSRQVGTSGKTVRPKVYVALGISGAFQHLAGMKGASTIIAVNKDPAAPIFGVADVGWVGDCLDLLPELTKALS